MKAAVATVAVEREAGTAAVAKAAARAAEMEVAETEAATAVLAAGRAIATRPHTFES